MKYYIIFKFTNNSDTYILRPDGWDNSFKDFDLVVKHKKLHFDSIDTAKILLDKLKYKNIYPNFSYNILSEDELIIKRVIE